MRAERWLPIARRRIGKEVARQWAAGSHAACGPAGSRQGEAAVRAARGSYLAAEPRLGPRLFLS